RTEDRLALSNDALKTYGMPSFRVTSTYCSAAAKVESRSSTTLMPPNRTKGARLDTRTESSTETLMALLVAVTWGASWITRGKCVAGASGAAARPLPNGCGPGPDPNYTVSR